MLEVPPPARGVAVDLQEPLRRCLTRAMGIGPWARGRRGAPRGWKESRGCSDITLPVDRRCHEGHGLAGLEVGDLAVVPDDGGQATAAGFPGEGCAICRDFPRHDLALVPPRRPGTSTGRRPARSHPPWMRRIRRLRCWTTGADSLCSTGSQRTGVRRRTCVTRRSRYGSRIAPRTCRADRSCGTPSRVRYHPRRTRE